MHGIGLVFWHCVKWLRHVVFLISMWYCRSFYKGNSCNHYSYSYVIIWYVKHLYTVQARGTFIHLACQYIYFPLLVLFFFAAVKQYTLSKQLVFLRADEWIQKERYTRIMEISTLQDLVQKGFTRINIMISIAITIRTSLSAFLCVATIMYQSQIYHICRWIELSGARSEYPALCRNDTLRWKRGTLKHSVFFEYPSTLGECWNAR